MKYSISKSSYIRGLQCQKSLYLYKYFYKDRDPLPPERQQRFKAGHQVGFLARQLFPGGLDLTPAHISRYYEMAHKTKEAIARKEEILYEPSFIHEEVLVAADIMVLREGWEVYEVKSSVNISPTYLEDAALQYHVISGAGINIRDFNIIHLKKKHTEILEEETADEIFQITSVKEHCIASSENVKSALAKIKNTLSAPGIPKIKMGDHCSVPYDCDFKGFCTRQEQLLTKLQQPNT